MLGTSSLLRSEAHDERTLQSLLRIHSSAERASRFVEDLLDFTQARHCEGEPELRERLFEPMQRGSTHADSAGRSVGLGLYIVDQLVRAHGGSVSVTSTLEEGTTFTVRLPRATTQPQPWPRLGASYAASSFRSP